jgi:pyruvate, water dikinase
VDCASCGAGGDDGAVVCRGLTAVPGCVEGTVRVVLDPREADRLVAGEILVAPMTDPDSVPAMSRAAAVVTDRGGVLCHAAITSREMHKPCVVGTRTATAALATGMRVRVCATRGIVAAVAAAEETPPGRQQGSPPIPRPPLDAPEACG